MIIRIQLLGYWEIVYFVFRYATNILNPNKIAAKICAQPNKVNE